MPDHHCRHIKEDGIYCHTPPLRGRNYCFSHLRLRGQRLSMARQRAQLQSQPLLLPPFDDLGSINAGLTQVAIALAFERIDERRAGLLGYLLQQAASNLKFIAAQAAAGAGTESGERVEEYPGFEAEFGLPPGFDLETPPEVAFPLPVTSRAARSTFRSNPWHHINPEDIELEELQKTKGEEAYQKRMAELSKKEHKLAEQERRALDYARWLVEADRRNNAPPLSPEEQRARDLQIIADFEAQHPKPLAKPEPDETRKPASAARGTATSPATVAKAQKRNGHG